MKKIALFLILALLTGLFAGCAGTPVVYYTNCTCPVEQHSAPAATENTTPAATENTAAEGELKTGLYIGTSVSKSVGVAEGADGSASYDVTIVAVTVDGNGVIRSCIIDSLGANVGFDANGALTSDVTAELLTKNELGENYGMKAAGSKYEWNEQAAFLAEYAVGKTVEELKSGAVNESGKAADADLATKATVYIGGYVTGIEKAAANATYLGAQDGDVLKLAISASAGKSTAATAEANGNAQLDLTAVALTMNGDKITSCAIDAVQAKVGFDSTGAIAVDVSAPVPTKTELGYDYNMVNWGQAKAEWYEQAASFSQYVTGKTVAEVTGIAVDEGTKPTGEDLNTSVTIAIGDFQALIAKAAQ